MIPGAAADDGDAGHRATRLGLRQRLATIFTPTRPLAGGREGAPRGGGPSQPSFIGREAERQRIMRALLDDRSHVVIFGERGRGKTSLANHVITQVQSAAVLVARHVCSATSSFDSIMRALFQDLPNWLIDRRQAASSSRNDVGGLLPSHPLQPSDIPAICSRFREFRIVFLLDEFDRITDVDTRTAVADTLKQLSDKAIPVLFMIIGVSDSPEALLGRHPSIQRCVTRVPLPLLKNAEVEQIVERGAAQVGLDFTASARTCIAELARGVPYMAQLLSLRAGQAALDHGRTEILGGDLLAAIEAAAIEADPRILTLYDLATDAERDAAALAVMRAAAAGLQDELGRFQAVPDGPFVRLAGQRVDPTAWQRVLNLGAIRAVRGEGPDLYTFTEAMLPQLVLLRAVLSRRAAA